MKNLMTAIYNKFNATNDLNTAINGRMYYKRAPDKKEFPYIVFDIISDVPEWTFTDNYENAMIQFDIFVIAGVVSGQIEDIYANLKSLYDDCSLSITGNTFLYMWRQNLVTTIEEYTTNIGTSIIEHWSIDYEIKMETV